MLGGEDERELAIGTGFLYLADDTYFLITNGHNLTGINPESNVRLSKHAAFPTAIKLMMRCEYKGGELAPIDVPENHIVSIPTTLVMALYEDEEYQVPGWLIHPMYGYQVDVVAIPMYKKDEVPEGLFLYPINTYGFQGEAEVADDVYILGYPFGIAMSQTLPVWKRASIATEPRFDYRELPRLLVDTATRSGMSGSPVVFMRTGWHGSANGQLTSDSMLGTITGFVGVYSGRIGGKD
ncbi:MAG TPA: hypothetical protein VF598_11810, partial [Hymenobacter sp.]